MADFQLYEAVCTRGQMRMHVPLIRWRGQWRNANTGHIEPWVYSSDPMSVDRAAMFLLIAAQTIRKLETGQA